jgi:hypothetical protein
MKTILGLGPGKIKCVACLHDPGRTAARFTAFHTDPNDLRKRLHGENLALVVFETGTAGGRPREIKRRAGRSDRRSEMTARLPGDEKRPRGKKTEPIA